MTIPELEFIYCAVKMPLMMLPVRTVVVPVAGGRVMLSPCSALSPDALAKAGAITDLVAPSLFHTAGMKAAAAAHPRARLWGPAGCREKHPELKWHGVLGQDAWRYDDELGLVPLQGMPNVNECVFLHRASRSLLVADLVFNVIDSRGFGAWLLMSMFGTYRRFGMSRFIARCVKDRAAFETSLARVLELDFEKVVPCHGDVVTTSGRSALSAALGGRGFASALPLLLLIAFTLPFLAGCPKAGQTASDDTTPLGSAPAGETMTVAIPSLDVELDVPAGSEVIHASEGATIYTRPGARNPRALSIEQWPSPPIHTEPATAVLTKKLSANVTIEYEIRNVGGSPGSGGEETHLYGRLTVDGEPFAVHCHDQAEPPALPDPIWCLATLATLH